MPRTSKSAHSSKPRPIARDAWTITRVKIRRAEFSFENIDVRRIITGVVGDFEFPFPLRQIKLVEMTENAVREGFVVGNHRHVSASGQWEVVLVLGSSDTPMFRFRYKNRGSKIYERVLHGGDMAIVPPGCTLAFLPLCSGARLLEISDQEYNAANYEKDALF